eukprot:GHVQ01041424.1.p1 GENE.GHVQ01041424.1~~GHVQ01041424.1.p1  ORF type:complete len:105 (-),score=14.91 GHVQ01041424.1:83-397(-)
MWECGGLCKDKYSGAHLQAVSLVDLYSTYDEVPDVPQLLLTDKDYRDGSQERGCDKASARFLALLERANVWILLMLIGIVTALVSFGMDFVIYSALLPCKICFI